MRSAQDGAGQRTAKIAFPVGKADWHPSVLPGPIVLVSTVDAAGEPNIAPKSWVSMMAFHGPVLAFGCHRSHATVRNAEAAGEFVVNIPPEALAERIWAMPASHGAERIARSGLTLLPARRVAPPLIGECRAHLECTLKSVTRLGAEVVVFGPDRSRPTGMIILAAPEDKAREIAEADPLVRGGARYVIRRWTRTF